MQSSAHTLPDMPNFESDQACSLTSRQVLSGTHKIQIVTLDDVTSSVNLARALGRQAARKSFEVAHGHVESHWSIPAVCP